VAALQPDIPRVERQLEPRTPYGHPVAWAEVAMVSDIGDSHELNDDRCLVLTSRDLGDGGADGPLGEYMLCLLADGATGSTFGDGASGAPAGWRASQLAQAAFVERFLASAEVDVLDRLKDGLRAADQALVNSQEGHLATTLTALFLASDGRACAASIGDSVLLVLPPTRGNAADRRLKKLGYEDTTAVGSGDTTLSYVDESELIEQWWPDKEAIGGGQVHTRVRPGTRLVLLTDGISDNLPVDVIDKLLHRHTLDTATVGVPRHTRERRAQTQKRGGGSTSELGLDNMSAIAVHFVGHRRPAAVSAPRLGDATLLTLRGTRGGPSAASGGQFALIALAGQEHVHSLLPGFLRRVLESEQQSTLTDRMAAAYRGVGSAADASVRLAITAVDEASRVHAFSANLAGLDALVDAEIVERSVTPARDSALQRFVYSPRLWASSIAAAAIFLLVSTAFATGTVRPSAPPPPTAVPGQPTSTPDTRPQLGIGGFQLVALAPPTATPAPTLTPEDTPTPEPATETPMTDTASCSNPFGVLCDAPPAAPAPRVTPRPAAPTRPPQRLLPPVVPAQPAAPRQSDQPPPQPDTGVVPVASPAPASDAAAAGVGPPPGSQLDRALKIASIANDQFNRSLGEPVPAPTATPRR
jgi:serine/threonine protein phosphatase PrpC